MIDESSVSLKLTKTDVAVIQRALQHYAGCEESNDWGEAGPASVVMHASGLNSKIGELTGIGSEDVPRELLEKPQKR